MITADDIAAVMADCGLTLTEVADRAGFDPEEFWRHTLHHMPYAVLARLAETLGQSPFQPPWQHDKHKQEEPTDSATIGAYLAAGPAGSTRDALAEALDWGLLRIEQALAALDASLRTCGLRLALNQGRVTIVSRLERTNAKSRIGLGRLHGTPNIEPEIAELIWNAQYGITMEDIEKWDLADFETLKIAESRELVYWRHGKLRPGPAVEFSVRLNGYN